MTFANNLDPDEAQQNVGLHLRSKLLDIQIIYQQKNGWQQWIFLKNLKEIFEKITQHAKSSYNLIGMALSQQVMNVEVYGTLTSIFLR